MADRKGEGNDSGISTIFFDVGGVLLADFIEAKTRDLAAKHGVSLERLREAKEKFRPLADLGRMSDPEFWARILAEVGVRAAPEDWEIDPYMREVPGMRALAERLKRDGRRIAILSNDSKEMSQARRERYGFDAFFHDLTLSWEHGVVKPDPWIYEIALKRMNARPAECVFTDDTPRNVEAAARVGIHGILFRGDAGELERELKRLGI